MASAPGRARSLIPTRRRPPASRGVPRIPRHPRRGSRSPPPGPPARSRVPGLPPACSIPALRPAAPRYPTCRCRPAIAPAPPRSSGRHRAPAPERRTLRPRRPGRRSRMIRRGRGSTPRPDIRRRRPDGRSDSPFGQEGAAEVEWPFDRQHTHPRLDDANGGRPLRQCSTRLDPKSPRSPRSRPGTRAAESRRHRRTCSPAGSRRRSRRGPARPPPSRRCA